MASLTPGVLSKLLNNAANKDVKVTGDHRSPLLQVIEILPSLAGAEGDPWRSRGFFLKVSDSMHSAYVSISDDDLDLIYNDQIQLGQFVYVTRLDSASPVPILRGLKPVPNRRSCPCVGNPVDLVPSDLLPLRADFRFARPKTKVPKIKPENAEKGSDRRDSRNDIVVKAKARSSVSGDAAAAKSRNASLLKSSPGKKMSFEGLEMRRLSLDSARRAWDQTPACNNTVQRAASRFKSKQVPHSVISEKEVSPKNISSSNSKRPNLSISPLKNKNNSLSPPVTNKALKKEVKPSTEGSAPLRLIKVPLTYKTGTGQKISWDVLPPTITELGKQAVHHRNVAFLASVHSLEEASAAEGVICSMCIFAELCESSQKSSSGAVVQNFLDLNQRMQSAAMIVESLLNSRLSGSDSTNHCSQQQLLPDACKASGSKKATSWVKAAIGTNLSTFDLFRKQDNDEIINGEKCHYVVLENTPIEVNSKNSSPGSKQSHRILGTHISDTTAKGSQSASGRISSAARKSNTGREVSSKGSRLKELASLADKLLLASREWFLKYLEDSLNIEFRMKREDGNPEVASLLGQLKRLNLWLDNLVISGDSEDQRIEGLRKKLYGFLLEHVDSGVVTSQ